MHCTYAVSYRDCKAAAEAPPACAPLKLPSRRPLPPPMAAPTPGLPVTAPMSAPAAAPTTVPTAPLATALWVPASAGPGLVWDPAYCRQSMSSAWKTSKGFPGAGNTITFGPLGTVTQALSTLTPSSTIPHLTNIPLLLTMAAYGYPTTTPYSLMARVTRYYLFIVPCLKSTAHIAGEPGDAWLQAIQTVYIAPDRLSKPPMPATFCICQVEEHIREHGVQVNYATINRWAIA